MLGGGVLEKLNDYVWFTADAAKNNQTVTMDLINQTMGEEFTKIVQCTNSTQNGYAQLIEGIQPYILNIPEWLITLIFFCIILFLARSLVFEVLGNLFLILTFMPVLLLSIVMVLFSRSNVFYIYVVVVAWMPIAATVDSFLRIYIYRAIFFRLLKNHPLIRGYAEGSV